MLYNVVSLKQGVKNEPLLCSFYTLFITSITKLAFEVRSYNTAGGIYLIIIYLYVIFPFIYLPLLDKYFVKLLMF